MENFKTKIKLKKSPTRAGKPKIEKEKEKREYK